MRQLFLFGYFLFQAFLIDAQTGATPTVLFLQGTIDGKYEIELQIQVPTEMSNDCESTNASYTYKTILQPIYLQGEICKDGILLNCFNENQVLLEHFNLKVDKSSGKELYFTGTWTKGTKSLKVELQEVNIKNNTMTSVALFGQFVNQVAEDLSFANAVAWTSLPTPIYSEDNLISPSEEARNAMGMSITIKDHGIGYLRMEDMITGAGRGVSYQMIMKTLPDNKTPTFLVIDSESGYYTEDMYSDDPKEVNIASLNLYIYQFKDGKMKDVTSSLAPNSVFQDYKSFKEGFNLFQIETNDNKKINLAWENGKLVKK